MQCSKSMRICSVQIRATAVGIVDFSSILANSRMLRRA